MPAAFYDPEYIGVFDIATSQRAKTMTFTCGAAVIAGAKVVLSRNGVAYKTYTVGDGIVLSDSDTIATLTMTGTDLARHVGTTLKGEVNLFVLGDVEITFDLKVENSTL